MIDEAARFSLLMCILNKLRCIGREENILLVKIRFLQNYSRILEIIVYF